LCRTLFVFFVTRNASNTMAAVVPAIVTIKGALFIASGTTRVGGINMNLEKNQPERIVPIDRRIKAPFKLIFSSFMGGSENTFGETKKQKTTIRRL